MATEKVINAKLKLEFEVGKNENGEAKTKSKTLSKLNTQAQAEAIKTTADKIASLLTTPLHKTVKITETEIAE